MTLTCKNILFPGKKNSGTFDGWSKMKELDLEETFDSAYWIQSPFGKYILTLYVNSSTSKSVSGLMPKLFVSILLAKI